MFKKTITYKDFNDVERTEDFFFNLTEAEVIEWMTTNSSATLDDILTTMRRSNDVAGILGAAKDLIYRAYGEKSADGRRFVKTPEIKANFMETNAYSVLFMEMMTNADAAADFLNAVIPKELAGRIKALTDAHPGASTDELVELAKAGAI